jgi:hypothetical protein
MDVITAGAAGICITLGALIIWAAWVRADQKAQQKYEQSDG